MKLHMERRTLITILCTVFAIFFAAHAFCYLNLSFSGTGLSISAAQQQNAQISAGQYAQMFYWRLRGPVASPLIIGTLSCAYIALTLILLCAHLSISNTLSIAALALVLTTHISITALNASALHTMDVVFLSFLLSVAAAVCCMRFRFGFIPGAVLLVVALALYPATPSFFFATVLISHLRFSICPEQKIRPLFSSMRLLLAFGGGCLVYYVGYFLMVRRQGLDPTAVLCLPCGVQSAVLPAMLVQAWTYPIAQLFSPLTAYTTVSPVLSALMLLAAIILLILVCKGSSAKRIVCIVVSAFLLPLSVNLPVFSDSSLGQTSYAFCLIGVYFIVLLDSVLATFQSEKLRIVGQRSVLTMLGISALGVVIFSNQVYLKKNLEIQSTASLMTRIIQRAETTESFEPGSTPVAFIGTLDDAEITIERKGFEHLHVLEAASGVTSAATTSNAQWFAWEVLGYPFNFVSEYEASQLAQTDTVHSMHAFPAADSMQMIDGTLVIKLSD